jgi:hypothetical protein
MVDIFESTACVSSTLMADVSGLSRSPPRPRYCTPGEVRGGGLTRPSRVFFGSCSTATKGPKKAHRLNASGDISMIQEFSSKLP